MLLMNIFGPACEVAEAIEHKAKIDAAHAAEVAKVDEKIKQDAIEVLGSVDKKLTSFFEELEGFINAAGVKGFRYQRYEQMVNVNGGLVDPDKVGAVITHKITASESKMNPIEISLFVKKGQNQVSTSLVDYEAARDGKWECEETHRIEDYAPDQGPTEGTRPVWRTYAHKKVYEPVYAGPIEEALSGWFSALASKNRSFSGALASGKFGAFNLKIGLDEPTELQKEEGHAYTLKGDCVKVVAGGIKYFWERNKSSLGSVPNNFT